MNTQILVPSAPILVESTRSIGYSFETAVANKSYSTNINKINYVVYIHQLKILTYR